MGQRREHLNYSLVGWLDDEVDKADLTLRYVRGAPIEELTDIKVVHLFEIALLKELDEEKVAPETTKFEWLRRVRDVSQVEHELDEQFFVLALDRIELVILDTTAQLTQFHEVLRHVSC